MKIDYIAIKNYRQYKDPRKVEFTNPDKRRNFIIIEGANGEGKSNILNAITWCLYGKEIHLKEKAKGLPRINTVTLNELKSGNMADVEVSIQMTDEEEGDVYKFVRKEKYRKLTGGGVEKIPYSESRGSYSGETEGTEFRVYKLKRNDWDIQEHPQTCVWQYMPEDILEYFFFDGERLNEYFKETSGEKIKEAIFNISRLDLLEKLIEHLDSTSRNFLKTTKDLPPKVEQLQEEIDSCDEVIKKSIIKIKERQSLIKKAEEDIGKIREKLKNYPPGVIRSLANDRDNAERELNELETKIEDELREKNDYLVKVASIIYSGEAIIRTKNFISKCKEAGEIPPKYRKGFIQKLLDNNKCICGNDLSAGRDCRKKVEELLNECKDISEVSGEIMELNGRLEDVLEKINEFNEKQIKYGKNIRELENKEKELTRKIEEIGKKLKGIKNDSINELQTHFEDLEKTIKEEHMSLGELKKELEYNNDTKKKLEKEKIKELEKVEKLKEITSKLSFCNRSIDIAKKIKDEIMQEIRKEIEKKTQQQFFELHWKKEISTISIDSDYNISVKNQFDMEQIDTLSSGEKQLLALSFMAALNNVSGFKAPLVIDTPLGRFSKEPKENIAENLPNYLKDRQVTLLVTDEEYTSDIRKKLSSRVGREYEIHFEETPKGNQAEIESYE